jgi:hypothetical protein
MSLRKLRKLKKKNTDIAKMIQEIGNDLIVLGETAETREKYLQTVCVAWNISCLPEHARETNIEKFVQEFQIMNQCSDENTRNFENSVRLVIDEKLRLYPNVFIEVIESSLVVINGRDQFRILSRKMK